MPETQAITIHRFTTHHVLLAKDGFTIEHPPTCDLTECDLWQRAYDEWDQPPEDFGWWKLEDDLIPTFPEQQVAWTLTRDL